MVFFNALVDDYPFTVTSHSDVVKEMEKAVHLYFFKINNEIEFLLFKEYRPFFELFLDGLNTVVRYLDILRLG